MRNECPHCKNGYSEAYSAIKEHIQSLLWDKNVVKNADYKALTTFLCGRKPGDFGHDSSDIWAAMMKLGEIAGLKEGWQKCKHCDGSGKFRKEAPDEQGY